jgi:hypothetical protein
MAASLRMVGDRRNRAGPQLSFLQTGTYPNGAQRRLRHRRFGAFNRSCPEQARLH